jgi:hypothetical protein
MYSEELDSAKRAIAIMALRQGIPEEQIRAEIQEAIHESFISTDPKVKEQLSECEFTGSEPTPEEFISWISRKCCAIRNI